MGWIAITIPNQPGYFPKLELSLWTQKPLQSTALFNPVSPEIVLNGNLEGCDSPTNQQFANILKNIWSVFDLGFPGMASSIQTLDANVVEMT